MKSLSFVRLINTLLVVTSLAFGLSSCQKEDSDNVNQDRIYADYSLVYDKGENKTFARAAFRFGNVTGTALELKAPSEVRFGSDAPTFVPGVNYYERSYPGLQNQITFTFKDINGKTFTNSISALEPIEFPASFTTLTKGTAYPLSWDGPVVRPGEFVDVTLDGAGPTDPIQSFLQLQAGATSLTLDADRIGRVDNGAGRVAISRTRNGALQQGTSAGGTLTSRYQGQSKTIIVQ
ncbi:hypothetical protein IC235_04040 [Hymenobacter sp. BT664]|uniref:DUF4397 domain-containing protein n=1 Tax=Hymenobacter montanus TaxID=2771359 RepID=A0A927GIF3_9BACT|nr:hypothetical protein [Hymenobacter montanus]MBD2767064.1 hypothetical protein [Hymenobacter montanus]